MTHAGHRAYKKVISRTVPVIPYSFSANDYSTAMSSLPIL